MKENNNRNKKESIYNRIDTAWLNRVSILNHNGKFCEIFQTDIPKSHVSGFQRLLRIYKQSLLNTLENVLNPHLLFGTFYPPEGYRGWQTNQPFKQEIFILSVEEEPEEVTSGFIYILIQTENLPYVKQPELTPDNWVNLTLCNNCDSYLIDHNADCDAEKYPPEKADGELKQLTDLSGNGISNDVIYFWGCPNCLTDDYLTDV